MSIKMTNPAFIIDNGAHTTKVGLSTENPK